MYIHLANQTSKFISAIKIKIKIIIEQAPKINKKRRNGKKYERKREKTLYIIRAARSESQRKEGKKDEGWITRLKYTLSGR